MHRDGRRSCTPTVGEIYAFRTSPISEFAAPQTYRYAAFKVIGTTDGHISVAVLDGVWAQCPTLQQATTASVLRERRFAFVGRPAVFGVIKESWKQDGLAELVLIGEDRVTREEDALAKAIASYAPGSSFSTLPVVNSAAEGEWRWAHERDAFVVEMERKKAKDAAERAAKEERYRTRLKKLTWEQLLAEVPFERWSSSPPYPPKEFTVEARQVVHESCRSLNALGPKPRKADVRKVLRQCVQWFNEADARAGRVIETEERVDICAVLEEMAYVARQKGLVHEIDEWRQW